MQTGTVKFFNETKGFGFIRVAANNSEIFVHVSALKEEIHQDDEVTFDLVEGKSGLNAVNVRLGIAAAVIEKKITESENFNTFYKHGLEVFEDAHKFENWLKKENGALNGQIPGNLIHTKEGLLQVDKILGRIEHGIFS